MSSDISEFTKVIKSTNNQSEISLKEISKVLKLFYRYLLSNFLLILLIGMIVGLIGFVYANKKPLKYESRVIFVVENNMYSSHMDIAQRQPYDSVARFARSHAVESRVVDGNDVIAVSNAAGELIARARKGDGPGFLEGVTYRWLGHVGANHDIDVGVRRSISELDAWKARDPIKRLELAMKNLKIYDQNHFDQFKEKTAGDLERMVIEARNAPWPEYSALLDYVYSQNQRDAQ